MEYLGAITLLLLRKITWYTKNPCLARAAGLLVTELLSNTSCESTRWLGLDGAHHLRREIMTRSAWTKPCIIQSYHVFVHPFSSRSYIGLVCFKMFRQSVPIPPNPNSKPLCFCWKDAPSLQFSTSSSTGVTKNRQLFRSTATSTKNHRGILKFRIFLHHESLDNSDFFLDMMFTWWLYDWIICYSYMI